MIASFAQEDRLFDAALGWHRALDADDADWDGFTVWLNADPRHRAAFDAVALTDRIIDDQADRLREILPAPEQLPARRSRRRWVIGAVAAALAAAVGLPMALLPRADVTYAAGRQMRHVALAGGVSVDLAPGSTLIARGGDASRLAVTGGEAYFDVAHDPVRRLAIQAGDYSVSDIGTRFAINVAGKAVLVGVAAGQVAIDPDGSAPAVTVATGQRFVAEGQNGAVSLGAMPLAAVGSWRQGQLSYDDAPLGVVAADISRYVGMPVDLDPALAERRFSGVLKVGDGSALLSTLADVMALSYRTEGNRIRVSAAPAR